MREILGAISISLTSVVSSFERSLEYEKAIRRMGVEFAHNWSQSQSCDNFEGAFEVV